MRRLLREVALSLGAVAGLLGIALAVASVGFGLRPMVVTSGSMSPAMHTGSLAWARTVEADELRVGDVVSVDHADGGRVTHRVASIAGTGDERVLTLRGDANATEDPQLYVVREADRVVASVEGAGSVLLWLSSPAGVLVTVGCVLALLVSSFRRDGREDEGAGPAGRSSRRPLAASGVCVVLVASLVAVGVGTVRSSRAAWTDQAVAPTGQFTAHTVRSPAAPGCTNQGGVLGVLGFVRLSWTHLDARYAYSYTVTRVSNGQVVGTGLVQASVAVGATQTFDLASSLLTGTLLGTNDLDVTIRSVVNGSTSWTSAPSASTRVHTASAVVGISLRCGPA